jgi:hypothetical protein
MKSPLVFGTAILLCALFFAQGYLFVRQVGVQEDEVLFASAVVPPTEAVGTFGVLPIMILNYAGSMKALIYSELFRAFPADARSIRMPMLVLGTITVFLFFLFFRMTMGDMVALIATALLAVDPIFVITTVLDWGIDVIQHLLAAAALPLFVLYHRRRDPRHLQVACFLCGLGLWDKVTFVWLMTGVAVATVLVFREELKPHWTRATLQTALIWMCLGAAPLIYFNVFSGGATIRENGGIRPPGAERAAILAKSLNGSVLFGWITRQVDTKTDRAPQTSVERALVALSNATGHQEQHGLLFASLAALVFWRQKAVRFCAIAFVVGWVSMLPFAMGAAGAHHLVLLWPLPHLMVAAAICSIPRLQPWQCAAAALPLVLWSALVTNEHYSQIVTRGNVRYWSDAMEPLRKSLAETETSGIVAIDWGIMGPLRTLGRGTLPLKFWDAPKAALFVKQPGYLFVRYADREGLPDEGFAALRNAGATEEVVAEIADRHGRPVYVVTRYRQN